MGTLEVVADWVQIFGIFAIPVALWQLVRAKHDIIRDRRLTHELEVLRAFNDLIFGLEDPISYMRATQYLLLIPGSDDLPMLRAALDARPSDDALRVFAQQYPAAPALPHPGTYNPGVVSKRLESLAKGVVRGELQQAIECRITLPQDRRNAVFRLLRLHRGHRAACVGSLK